MRGERAHQLAMTAKVLSMDIELLVEAMMAKDDAQKVEELFAEITEILQSRVKDDSQASRAARSALHDVEGAQIRAAHVLSRDEDEDEQER